MATKKKYYSSEPSGRLPAHQTAHPYLTDSLQQLRIKRYTANTNMPEPITEMRLLSNYFRHIPKPAMLAGLTAALIVIAIAQTIAYNSDKNQKLHRRDLALVNASELRSTLENHINSQLIAARGVVAYVQLHGEIGQPEFERLAASLVGDNPLIINLALLKGSVVQRVYPWKNNEFVIGFDARSRPEQVAVFQRMIESGKPALVGPVEVMQGHSAFIGRVPIYRKSVINSSEPGDYWGSTAMVINANRLYENTGLAAKRGNLRFAMRSSDGQGGNKPVFFGDPQVFEQQPVLQTVRLPGDSYWEIAAMPTQGWNHKGWLRQLAMLFGFALATIIGLLTCLLVRNQQHISHSAMHDSLSGLPNRRLFLDRFEQAVSAAERYQRSFAVLLLDLDGFKAINDSLGHAAGDAVIRETAKRLCSRTRASDTVARYGGDEFVLLIQNSDEDNARDIAEQLRLIVPQTLMFNGQPLHITASIGIAMYPPDGITMEDLLSQADAALYVAKNQGKNQVVAAENLPE